MNVFGGGAVNCGFIIFKNENGNFQEICVTFLGVNPFAFFLTIREKCVLPYAFDCIGVTLYFQWLQSHEKYLFKKMLGEFL